MEKKLSIIIFVRTSVFVSQFIPKGIQPGTMRLQHPHINHSATALHIQDPSSLHLNHTTFLLHSTMPNELLLPTRTPNPYFTL